MTSPRTLIVGSGKVGRALGERLLASGHSVLALRRDIRELSAEVTPIRADLASALEAPLPPVDAVVITLPPGEDPGFLARAVGHLADALPARPARTVFVSSTRVFEGWDDSRPIDERDEPRPTTARGRALVAAEQAALARLDALIVRPAGIYGPGRERLIRQVLAGEPVDHDRRTNRIHESDLADALAALVVADDPPRILHGVDRRPATLGEVVAFIADRLGMPVPPRGEPGDRRGTILDGARVADLLGDLRYPTFEEGYGALIAAR